MTTTKKLNQAGLAPKKKGTYEFAFSICISLLNTMYLLVHNSISKMRSSECSGSNSVLIIIISNIVRKKILKDVYSLFYYNFEETDRYDGSIRKYEI